MDTFNLRESFGLGPADTIDEPRPRTDGSAERRAACRRAIRRMRTILAAPDLRAEPLTDAERTLVRAVGAEAIGMLRDGRPFDAYRAVGGGVSILPGEGGGLSPAVLATRRRMMIVLGDALGVSSILSASSRI